MTDYETQQDSPRTTWVGILPYDINAPLVRFCIGVALLAVAGWVLIQMLTT